jgi:hypothetical protein
MVDISSLRESVEIDWIEADDKDPGAVIGLLVQKALAQNPDRAWREIHTSCRARLAGRTLCEVKINWQNLPSTVS